MYQEYEVDKVVAIADKVIKVYGYCNTKGLDNLARMLKEKSDITGKPLPYEYYGDVVDSNCIIDLFKKIRPDEVYNLAAQSHVQISFQIPDYTSQVNAIGTLKILDAIRLLNLKKTKFYEIWGI